jgi:hypothetical protein
MKYIQIFIIIAYKFTFSHLIYILNIFMNQLVKLSIFKNNKIILICIFNETNYLSSKFTHHIHFILINIYKSVRNYSKKFAKCTNIIFQY